MGSVLRLCTFLCSIAVIYAQCYFEPMMITDINKLPTGCQDSKGNTRQFGSYWVTEDCYACSCSQRGTGCCNKIPQFVEMPEDCQVLVDKKACTSKLVLKSNPAVECTGDSAAILK